jgi:hypothetical protein
MAEGESKPLSERMLAALDRAAMSQLFSMDKTRENPNSVDIGYPQKVNSN